MKRIDVWDMLKDGISKEEIAKKIFKELREKEGYSITLLDCSDEGDNYVWVAFVFGQTEEDISELKKELKEGRLFYPADDEIERIDELYITMRQKCEEARRIAKEEFIKIHYKETGEIITKIIV